MSKNQIKEDENESNSDNSEIDENNIPNEDDITELINYSGCTREKAIKLL